MSGASVLTDLPSCPLSSLLPPCSVTPAPGGEKSLLLRAQLDWAHLENSASSSSLKTVTPTAVAR